MIIDGVSATKVSDGARAAGRALAAFFRFIEREWGVLIVRDTRDIPGAGTLSDALRLASVLIRHGVIKNFGRMKQYADEPYTYSWYAICNDPTSHQAGGSSLVSDEDALFAALAESLERYIWFTQTDYFLEPTLSSVETMQSSATCIAPEQFAGYANDQRAGNAHREFSSGTEFLWIRATSLISGRSVYVPAQTVSPASHSKREGTHEPTIRPLITNGLATWPTKTGAQVASILELIEREAYMTLWLNQLTVPRLSLTSLRASDSSLEKNIAACERYGIGVHVLRMPTDAPTHAIAVVLEDMYGASPRFTIGLRAHYSLAVAVQKALTESLRARRSSREWADSGGVWDSGTAVLDIGHRDRLHYWADPENADRLSFLVAGAEVPAERAEWDGDTTETHHERLLTWCREHTFECVSVSLGSSSANPTQFHTEMIIMPDIMPTYLTERTRTFGSSRWKDIARHAGYTPRETPFADEPHPFS